MFVDWNGPYDDAPEPLSDAQVAEALIALYPPMPPYDPDDITTWSAEQLDELGIWAAAVDGVEIVWSVDEVGEHAVTPFGAHESTG